MKLKIVSDGTSWNTHVIDIETGQRLENVQSIDWSLDANSKPPMAKARIVLINIPVDIDVSGKTTIYEKSITIEHE